MDFQVGLTTEAIADLSGIVEFIARHSPKAAGRIGDELLAIIASLGALPNRGAPVFSRPSHRKLFRRHFAIYYRVNEQYRRVEILRIWDGRQAPWNLKF